MYGAMKDQAVALVRRAVQEDDAGDYAAALQHYVQALDYFAAHLRYEHNPRVRDAIAARLPGYVSRAEEIRALLDGGSAPCGPGGGGDQEEGPPRRRRGRGRRARLGAGQAPRGAPLGDRLREAQREVERRRRARRRQAGAAGGCRAPRQVPAVLHRAHFEGKRRPWRAFLLYGPPGTGKSYLAKAVATEADSTFFSISSSDLLSKWMGESEKLVANLFEMARENAPSIIFIDEIDSLCGQRGEGNESESSRRVKTELLVQMQGVGHNDDKVLVLAATNTPYALDQAVRRRFDKRVYIPLPDLKARQRMLKVHLGDTPHSLTKSDFENVAHRTDGFSGSDIAVCVKDVLFEPVRKTQDAMFFFRSEDNGGSTWTPCGPKQPGAVQTTMEELAAEGMVDQITPPPISRTDFDKVLARQRPTVSKAELGVYTRFTREFGEEYTRILRSVDVAI